MEITQDSNIRRALILFTSHPEKEAARKQVGATVEDTRKIYRALISDILRKIASAQQACGFDLIIASDAGDLPNLRQANHALPYPVDFQFVEHRQHTFEGKFKQALQTTFARDYEQVVIIGNDTPDLTPEMLENAFRQLHTHEAVVGPAPDGGFYLLGLTDYRPGYFAGIDWCSGSVLQQLLANLHRHHQIPLLLTPLGDIDSHAELKAWLCEQASRTTLLYLLLSALLRRCPLCFDYTHPFLTHRHLTRRIWQKPPPPEGIQDVGYKMT